VVSPATGSGQRLSNHCIRQRCLSKPISRVLSPPGYEPVEGGDHLSRATVARRLQRPTRGLRTSSPRRGRVSLPAPRPLLGLAPGGVCLAGPVARAAGELLLHLFTLTGSWLLATSFRRYVSVALSVGSPRLGVTQHRALWSSDFPRTAFRFPCQDEATLWEEAARDRLACLSTDLSIAHTPLAVK